MTVEEFVNTGCLQEINRQLLHPRGLALAIERDEENNIIGFHPNIIENPYWKFDFANMSEEEFSQAMYKQDAFEALFPPSRQDERIEREGYLVEPVKQ